MHRFPSTTLNEIPEPEPLITDAFATLSEPTDTTKTFAAVLYWETQTNAVK